MLFFSHFITVHQVGHYLSNEIDNIVLLFVSGMEDWDVVAPTEVAHKQQNSNLGLDKASFLGSLTGAVTAQVGKTVSQMSKAIGNS